jgi:3-oxoacyl-[acyl-carrier protein] reductase
MKIILITGTTKGIGNFLANYYLEDENNYVIGCGRSASTIHNEKYSHYQLDISNEQAVIKMCKSIFNKFKKIDILINNAGLASMNHSLMTPGSTIQKLINTNYFGTFLMCREIGKLMSINRFGRIINFSTVAAPLYLEGELAYAASKAAVETLTRIFAKELGSYGITCNCIGPTPIDTDLIKNVSEEKIDKLILQQAIHRKADFYDVVNVINFFSSNQSSMITGQIIYLGGVF